MKKNKIFIGIAFIVGVIFWKNYIPKSSIVGTYVNNNTEPILDGPNSIDMGQDTLVLFENGKFKSLTWGTGSYEISSGFQGKEIDLTYTYEFGKAGFSTQISKSIFGKLRIWLNYDLEFYFVKID